MVSDVNTDFESANRRAMDALPAEFVECLLCEKHAWWMVYEGPQDGVYTVTFDVAPPHPYITDKQYGPEFSLTGSQIAETANLFMGRLEHLAENGLDAVRMACIANIEMIRIILDDYGQPSAQIASRADQPGIITLAAYKRNL